MIKKLSLLLCLVLVFSLLSACKPSKDENDVSSNNESSVSSEEPSSEPEDTADEPSEESTEETPEEEELDSDYFDEDYFDDEYKHISQLHVYNNENPLSERYGGMSGTVWHAFGFMKDDKTNRVYTDKMMNIELDRLQNTGMHYCRTR